MERPILFSGPMVRAILDGGKTQTRRIVKDSPVYVTTFIGRDNKPTGEFGIHLTHDRVINKHVRCPYGQPGDRLWVRETWAEQHPCAVPADRHSLPGRAGIPGPPGVKYRVIYRADGEQVPYWHCHEFPYRTADRSKADAIDLKHHPDGHEAGWLPSIHMPRWASRLTLEVTEVRVERLQDISEEDARAEGCVPAMYGEHWTAYNPEVEGYPSFGEPPDPARYESIRHHPAKPMGTARDAFRRLWGEINGYAGPKSWEASPWVWCVSFKVAEVRR